MLLTIARWDRLWEQNSDYRRYILTAIDRHTKVAFARMYTHHSSFSARDFLYRLHLLLDGKIENVQTDNGSEFHRYFEDACQKLGLEHYWSRTQTPKDNAVNERFNRTLQEEFLSMGNMVTNTTEFQPAAHRVADRIQFSQAASGLELLTSHQLCF
jgi:transposase InsO family protein